MSAAPPPPPPPPVLPKFVASTSSNNNAEQKFVTKVSTSSRIKDVQQQISFRSAISSSASTYEHTMSNGTKIVVEQTTAGESKGLGTGSTVWHCGLGLTRYLEEIYGNNNGLVGKRIVELGSGTGIVGIIAAYLGADVTFTDMDVLLALIERNIDRNIASQQQQQQEEEDSTTSSTCSNNALSRERMRVRELSWGNQDHIRNNLQPPYDMVIASDCILDKFPLDLLVITLRAISHPGIVIWLAYEHRNNRSRRFFQLLNQDAETKYNGFYFHLERVYPTTHYLCDDIELYKVTYSNQKPPPQSVDAVAL